MVQFIQSFVELFFVSPVIVSNTNLITEKTYSVNTNLSSTVVYMSTDNLAVSKNQRSKDFCYLFQNPQEVNIYQNNGIYSINSSVNNNYNHISVNCDSSPFKAVQPGYYCHSNYLVQQKSCH